MTSLSLSLCRLWCMLMETLRLDSLECHPALKSNQGSRGLQTAQDVEHHLRPRREGQPGGRPDADADATPHLNGASFYRYRRLVVEWIEPNSVAHTSQQTNKRRLKRPLAQSLARSPPPIFGPGPASRFAPSAGQIKRSRSMTVAAAAAATATTIDIK